jgi:hypothetical protein
MVYYLHDVKSKGPDLIEDISRMLLPQMFTIQTIVDHLVVWHITKSGRSAYYLTYQG